MSGSSSATSPGPAAAAPAAAPPVVVEAPAARPATPAWQRALLVAAGVVVAIAPPFVLESFQLFQLTMAVLGLNIVTGYNGQISLGHGAFFAVGAYCTAILMFHFEWSFWWTLPVS